MDVVTPFVGRAHELEVLERALHRASDGIPQLVMLDADPGFGKSAVLSAFTAAHSTTHTLSWAGDEAESQLPHGMLGYLLESTARWPDPFVAGAAALRHISDLQARTSGDGPLLLALDDLPLADRPSLVALNFMVRRLRQDPVLIVTTARTRDLAALPVSLARMAEESGTRLTLQGLTVPEIQALAIALNLGRPSGRAAARLAAHTGGNALHLKALLAEVPLADLEATLDRPIPAPASFAQLVLSDLAGATPTAQQLAIAASVLGERIPLADAAGIAGIDTAAALVAAEELTKLRLMRVDLDAAVLEFDHPLVRAAVYGDLGPASRSAQHRKAAEMLSRLQDEAGALRHRVAAAAGPDTAVAGDLETASERARRDGDLHTAATHMRTAHRLSPPGPNADRRLLATTDLLLAAGDAAGAHRYVDQLEALPPTGPRLAIQARLAWLTGHADQALTHGEQAWTRAQELTADQRDMLAAMMANVEILRARGEQATAWARRALSAGQLDPTSASQTRAQLALALATSGRLHEGLGVLDTLPHDPLAVPSERQAELAAWGHLRSWEGGQDVAAADQDVAGWSLANGDTQPFRFTATGGLAECLFRSGDWPRSQAVAEQLVSLAEDMEQLWLLGYVHYVAAAVPSATGDWATAERHVAEAHAAARLLSNTATAAVACDAEVFLATCRGEPIRVVAAAARLGDATPASPQRELGMFWWPVHHVSALVALNRLDEASHELDRIRSVARPGDRRCGMGIARVAGQLAASKRQFDEARAALADALDDPEHKGDVLERAFAHAAYGKFLGRRGERRAAIDHLIQARDQFAALGAKPFLARVGDGLRACGIDEPTTSHGLAESLARLTPQERVVATMVCAGQTNREIAQELVLSVKTIGYHLANIYTKLDVHSRVQLAAAMREPQQPTESAPTPQT